MLFDNAVNAVFLIDVFINYFSAYHDADYAIVDDQKVRNMQELSSCI